MASVHELIAAAEQIQRSKRSPLVELVDSAMSGYEYGKQIKSRNLDTTMRLMQIDQMRQEQERLDEIDRQAKAYLSGQREEAVSKAHKGVAGGGKPVLPVQKLVEVTTGKDGRYSMTFKPEGAATDGISPSLAYTMGKDREKQALDLKELQIPGYDLGDEVRPTTTEAKDLRTGVAAMNDFVKGVGRLSELIKQHGSSEFTGTAAGEMGTLAANLKLTLKEVQKLGVLSASDIAFLEAQIMDPTSMKSLGTRSETALKQLETVKGRAESMIAESLKTRGYTPRGGGQSSGPKPGAIEDGYRFKGGDPSDPNNWEKT